MSTPVVTVASGGLAVVELAAGKLGLPVTEATNGCGIAVTKVVGLPGLPVVFDTIGVLPPVTFNTVWNTADKSANVTLTNASLTASASSASNCAVRGTASKATGKYYFEVTSTGTISASGIGLATAAANLSTAQTAVGPIVFVNATNGIIFLNGGSIGGVTNTPPAASGDVTLIAVDLTLQRIWFRRNNTLWNNSVPADPATNTGGLDISSVFGAAAAFPLVTFGSTGLNHTANFGASAFAFAAPAGFTSGWPS